MLLTNVSAGVICWSYEVGGGWHFGGMLGAPWSLLYMGGTGFAGFSPHV